VCFRTCPVLWVIVFVLLTTIALNNLLFKPLLRVMRQRDETMASARAAADRAASEAARATAEFDTKTAAARAEVYREMDETRRVAQKQRTELVAARAPKPRPSAAKPDRVSPPRLTRPVAASSRTLTRSER